MIVDLLSDPRAVSILLAARDQIHTQPSSTSTMVLVARLRSAVEKWGHKARFILLNQATANIQTQGSKYSNGASILGLNVIVADALPDGEVWVVGELALQAVDGHYVLVPQAVSIGTCAASVK